MYEGQPHLDQNLEDACQRAFPGSIPANTDTITSNTITGLPQNVPDRHVIAPACKGNAAGTNCADSDYRWGLDIGTSLTQISTSSFKRMHLHRAYPGQGFALCVGGSGECNLKLLTLIICMTILLMLVWTIVMMNSSSISYT